MSVIIIPAAEKNFFLDVFEEIFKKEGMKSLKNFQKIIEEEDGNDYKKPLSVFHKTLIWSRKIELLLIKKVIEKHTSNL